MNVIQRRRPQRHSEVTPSSETDPAAAGVPVLDRAGAAFETIRASDLEIGVYRVSSSEEIAELGQDAVVLLAAYDANDLERAATLIAEHSTVVVGMGLGERCGSRALNLGALGYLHDGLGAARMRERFSEAITRHHYRQLRRSVAGTPLRPYR
jgi:AmiR/NasT family two-component response regulator